MIRRILPKGSSFDDLTQKDIFAKRDSQATIYRAVEKYGILVNPLPSGIVLLDIKDLRFYEVVLEKREDGAYLVTGNIKHFPRNYI